MPRRSSSGFPEDAAARAATLDRRGRPEDPAPEAPAGPFSRGVPTFGSPASSSSESTTARPRRRVDDVGAGAVAGRREPADARAVALARAPRDARGVASEGSSVSDSEDQVGDARRLAPSRAPRDARRRDRGASSAASSEADAAGSHSGSESDGDAIAAARPRARRGGIAPRDVLREARGSLL